MFTEQQIYDMSTVRPKGGPVHGRNAHADFAQTVVG